MTHSKIELILNQRKYTLILIETGKVGCKLVAISIEANHKYGKSVINTEKGMHQKLVEKLTYLTLTKLDIPILQVLLTSLCILYITLKRIIEEDSYILNNIILMLKSIPMQTKQHQLTPPLCLGGDLMIWITDDMDK